jgi:multidrug resistance efflux pump
MNTPTPDHWSPPRKGVVETVFIALIVLIALLSIARAWGWLPLLTGETTEAANASGRTTVIAPQVSGYVVANDAARIVE